MEPKSNSFVCQISSRLVTAQVDPQTSPFVNELVYVGESKYIGEVVSLDSSNSKASINVFELSKCLQSGLAIGDPIYFTNEFLSIEVGPGLLDNMFDGIQRPLSCTTLSTITTKKDDSKSSKNFNNPDLTLKSLPTRPPIDPIGTCANFESEQKDASMSAPTAPTNALDRCQLWSYTSNSKLAVGCKVSAGDVIGHVHVNNVITQHYIVVPPNVSGEIVEITPSGRYTIDKPLLAIAPNAAHDTIKNGARDEKSARVSITMTHKRPIKRTHFQNNKNKKRNFSNSLKSLFEPKMSYDTSHRQEKTKRLHTGLRVLDAFFPLCYGSTCAIPGPGLGMHVAFQGIIKNSDPQNIFIYVTCSHRTTSLTRIVSDWPSLRLTPAQSQRVHSSFHSFQTSETLKNNMQINDVSDASEDSKHSEKHTYKQDIFDIDDDQFCMQRVCLIANEANSSSGVTEASIYTALTVAEYFCEQGRNCIIMIDSISRWVEAVNEKLSYLNDRSHLKTLINSYYQRAAACTEASSGSITVITAVGPTAASGFGSVTSDCNEFDLVLSQSRVFWCLDAKMAQIKHFPSINWIYSFSKDVAAMQSDFEQLVLSAKNILQQEQDLKQKLEKNELQLKRLEGVHVVVLEVARCLREDFLQQNIFTSYDHNCSFEKTVGMLKCYVKFFELAKEVVERGKIKLGGEGIKWPLKWGNVLQEVADRSRDFGYSEKCHVVEKCFDEIIEKMNDLFDAVHVDGL